MKGALKPWICAGVKEYLPLASVGLDTVFAGAAESFKVTTPFMAAVIGAPLAAVPLMAVADGVGLGGATLVLPPPHATRSIASDATKATLDIGYSLGGNGTTITPVLASAR